MFVFLQVFVYLKKEKAKAESIIYAYSRCDDQKRCFIFSYRA